MSAIHQTRYGMCLLYKYGSCDGINMYIILPLAQQSYCGVFWFHSVHPSIRSSCMSTVLDAFFPDQVQMITSM